MKSASQSLKRPFTPALVSACVAIALFSNTLAGGFAYDFYAIARDTPTLLNPHTWGTFWTHAYLGGVDNLYRPLTSTLLGVQAYLNGLDESHAWRFHLVSVLMHAGVSALVAELARRLTSFRVAMIAGLLYAIQPIHVEVIGDIVGQAEMLCALGTVGAMVVFLHRPMTNLRAVGILLLFALAVLSKEQGMLLPLLLLCLGLSIKLRPRETLPNNTQSPTLQGRGQVLNYSSLPTTRNETGHTNAMKLLVLLLCWSLGGYIFIRERIAKFEWDLYFLDPAINPMKLSHGLDRALMPLVLLGHYTQLLILPWKLAPDYSGTAIGWQVRFDDPYFYLGLGAIGAWLILFAIALRKRLGVMLFCLLGIGITYGLIGNIVSIIGTNFAERLMYLPSAFFVILVAMGLAKLPVKLILPAMVVIVSLATYRSFTYALRWNDRLTLYEHAVQDQPGAVRMWMALAMEYHEHGEDDKALATADHACHVMPGYVRAWTFAGALAMEVGHFNEAARYLHQADEIEPTMEAAGLEQQLAKKRAATQRSQDTHQY